LIDDGEGEKTGPGKDPTQNHPCPGKVQGPGCYFPGLSKNSLGSGGSIGVRVRKATGERGTVSLRGGKTGSDYSVTTQILMQKDQLPRSV